MIFGYIFSFLTGYTPYLNWSSFIIGSTSYNKRKFEMSRQRARKIILTIGPHKAKRWVVTVDSMRNRFRESKRLDEHRTSE